MVNIDERKLVNILYEILAYTDLSESRVRNSLQGCLRFLDVYTKENKSALDKQIKDLTTDMKYLAKK